MISAILLSGYYNAILREKNEYKIYRSPYWELADLSSFDELSIYAVKNSASNAYLVQLLFSDIHVNYISEDEIISNIQEAGGCGIIYSEKALDNINQLENYWHVTDVLSQVEGTIWIYGENYADFLANKGYILE